MGRFFECAFPNDQFLESFLEIRSLLPFEDVGAELLIFRKVLPLVAMKGMATETLLRSFSPESFAELAFSPYYSFDIVEGKR